MHTIVKAVMSVAVFTSVMAVANVARSAPERIEGERCFVSRAAPGTWIGIFEGIKESPIISKEDAYYPVSIRRCFKTFSDCKAWKYWVQTDYPVAIRIEQCRQK